jgi:hypothetical protein
LVDPADDFTAILEYLNLVEDTFVDAHLAVPGVVVASKLALAHLKRVEFIDPNVAELDP